MRLADFQTPLANTTHVQSQQEAGQQAERAQPGLAAQAQIQEEIEENTTVQTMEEDEESAQIREEEERRNQLRRRRRRAPNQGRPPVPTQEEAAPSDGIHGLHFDARA